MGPLPVLVGLVTGLALAPLLAGVPAHADQDTGPQVGECYDLSDEQLAALWSDARPTDCSASHTVQVTSVHTLAPDDDPETVIDRECGPLGVWNELGVNRPVAGIITDPVRVEPRGFAIRAPRPSVACGASVVSWGVEGQSRVQSVTGALEELTPRARKALRFCIDPTVRRATGPGPTVSCTDVPRWQVRSWVVWSAFFDDYPGRSVLREQARRLCGPAARFTVPTRSEWSGGLPRTWCTLRIS